MAVMIATTKPTRTNGTKFVMANSSDTVSGRPAVIASAPRMMAYVPMNWAMKMPIDQMPLTSRIEPHPASEVQTSPGAVVVQSVVELATAAVMAHAMPTNTIVATIHT